MSDDVDFDPGHASLSSIAAALAADPEAQRWASHCAWVPGTGHCRNRPCSPACLFRAQRDAEAESVVHSRRRRRPSQQASAERLVRRL